MLKFYTGRRHFHGLKTYLETITTTGHGSHLAHLLFALLDLRGGVQYTLTVHSTLYSSNWFLQTEETWTKFSKKASRLYAFAKKFA